MKKSNNSVIRSKEDFEKLYYPKKYERQRIEMIEDAEALGAYMADKSLEKIKDILA